MAGHSKWANIKHRKGRADAAKGKVFSRIAKEIISAVKQGGPDHKSNPKLRLAIEKARAANMPNENIQRNIKKASSTDQSDYFELTYELYGHGGVGIIAEAMTDNKNRTFSDIHVAINKKGGSLASPGAVAFNFDQKGIIQISKDAGPEDEIFLLATEAGAEDFEVSDELYLVITLPEQMDTVKEKLENAKIPIQEADVERIPKVWVECDFKTTQANKELIEFLESLEDIDSVYHNMTSER